MQTQQLVTVFLIAFSVPQRHFQTNKQYKVKTFSITTQQKMWSILEYTLKVKNMFFAVPCCTGSQSMSVFQSMHTSKMLVFVHRVDQFSGNESGLGWWFPPKINWHFLCLCSVEDEICTLTPFNKMFSGACPSSPSYKRLAKSESSACLINVC